MEIKAGHYYECLSPPMKNFTKGKAYEVYESEFGYRVVREDSGVELDSDVWIDSRNFKDVTDKYEV